jgi:hypothetical protein
METYLYDGVTAHTSWHCDVMNGNRDRGMNVQKRRGVLRGKFVVFNGGISKTFVQKCSKCP